MDPAVRGVFTFSRRLIRVMSCVPGAVLCRLAHCRSPAQGSTHRCICAVLHFCKRSGAASFSYGELESLPRFTAQYILHIVGQPCNRAPVERYQTSRSMSAAIFSLDAIVFNLYSRRPSCATRMTPCFSVRSVSCFHPRFMPFVDVLPTICGGFGCRHTSIFARSCAQRWRTRT